jgi:hypothetical protein
MERTHRRSVGPRYAAAPRAGPAFAWFAYFAVSLFSGFRFARTPPSRSPSQARGETAPEKNPQRATQEIRRGVTANHANHAKNDSGGSTSSHICGVFKVSGGMERTHRRSVGPRYAAVPRAGPAFGRSRISRFQTCSTGSWRCGRVYWRRVRCRASDNARS